MKQTANYGLNQWEEEDRILRTDFNGDNSKIDSQLKAVADSMAAAVSARARVASGSYSGSGSGSVNVYCGFQPKLFFVGRCDSSWKVNITGTYGGSFGRGFQLYLNGANSVSTFDGGDTNGTTNYSANSSGISWTNTCPTSSSYYAAMAMNEVGGRYYWVAIG